jgi:hypothetical protein
MATETGTTTESSEVTGSTLLDHQQKQRLLQRGLYTVVVLLLVFLWIPLIAMMFLSFAVNASTFFRSAGSRLHTTPRRSPTAH